MMADIEIDNGVHGMTLGILALQNAGGPDHAGALKRLRQELESSLREKYGSLERAGLKTLSPMDVYIAYYKKFGYTYHVLPQLESVARGKDVPDALPPVAAMFMAALKNMLLTAGHDLDKIIFPLSLKKCAGDEYMPAMSGKDVPTVAGDDMVTDREGVISAILRGCDRRTVITEATKNVLYTVYAPEGVGQECVRRHLDDMEAYVRAYAAASTTLLKEVYIT